MKHLLLIALLFCCTGLSAQEIVIPAKVLANTKTGPMQYVGTDAFGWRYTIIDNEFRKEKDGQSLKYKSVSLGEISRVDLQNPLQIILFYRKFNTVVLLDNQLNETSRINFSDIPQPIIAEAVGLASQNRLWAYDINTQELGLYDLARGEFKPITPPFADTIRYYHNDYNYFYWIDTAGKCYMANLFGKVSDSLPVIKWTLGTETKKIGEYTCYKATGVVPTDKSNLMNYKPKEGMEEKLKEKDAEELKNTNFLDMVEMPEDKTITAWYTPEIPVSQGPENYWGLPGLILEVADDKTVLLCSKIVLNPKEKKEIKAPNKGEKVTQAEFAEIMMKKMQEMQEMYGTPGSGNVEFRIGG